MMPQPPSLAPQPAAAPGGAGLLEMMQQAMARGGGSSGAPVGQPQEGDDASAQAQALIEEIANKTKDLMLLAKAAFPNILPYLAQFSKIGMVIQQELAAGPGSESGSQETGPVSGDNPAAA